MKKYFIIILTVFSSVILLNGCEFAGLELQEDYEYKKTFLNPNINQTAWDFMNSRQDSLFSWMLAAIRYTHLDTLYKNPGNKTFFLLTNTAIFKADGNTGEPASGCFFFDKKVIDETSGILRSGLSWEDYPDSTVRELLLYHTLPTYVGWNELTNTNQTFQTFFLGHTWQIYNDGIMSLFLTKDRSNYIKINDFSGSAKNVQVRTAGIIATNGFINVVDNYAYYKVN